MKNNNTTEIACKGLPHVKGTNPAFLYKSRMKTKPAKIKTVIAGALALSAATAVHAQYTPPPPSTPFPGFMNDWMRQQNPYLAVLDIGGTERFRFEEHDGYAIAGQPGSLDFRDHGGHQNNDYFLSRLRVHLGYTQAWWSFYAEGQSSLSAMDDRWAYFASPAPAGTKIRQDHGPEQDEWNLHQAYITVGNHKEFPVSVKVGRQELSYGDERLIGAFGWNNIGRAFDAVKLHFQNEYVGLDLFSGHPVVPMSGRFDAHNDDDWLSGIYATTTKIPKTILETYFIARNEGTNAISQIESPQFPQPSAQDIYTVGGRIKSKPGELWGFDYTIEGAYQFGDFRDSRLKVSGNSPRLDQDAFMFCAIAGYTFADTWATPRISFEYNYASGDSNPTNNSHGTFVNLFPTNHKFFGSMDFFSLQNIQDVGGALTLKPLPNVSLALEGYAFWLANTHDNSYNVGGAPRGGITTTAGTGYGINPGYDSYVGSLVTVIGGWSVTKYALLEGGYSHFFHGNYIQQSLSSPAVGSRDADFVYAQMTLSF